MKDLRLLKILHLLISILTNMRCIRKNLIINPFICIAVSIDCEVGNWGSWGAAHPKTGMSERTRKVIKNPKNGGKDCPELIERKRGL